MRGGGLFRVIGAYLAIGMLWCLLVNLHAAIVGNPSVFAVVDGSMATGDKVVAVLGIIGSQVLLWPVDVYEIVLRPLLG